MGKSQIRGMQEISIERAVFLHEFPAAAFAVNIIADDRMPDGTEMHSNLMCAPGFDLHLKKRKTTEMFRYSIFRVRRSSLRFARSHFRARRWMAPHGQLDSPRVALKFPVNESDVGFLDLSILELFA